MKVSLITPTYQRHHFSEPLYHCFRTQTYADCELLVLDDSNTPDPFFSQLHDPRVQYVHTSTRLTVGEKRNRLAAAATGTVIAHFDDDDYYTPTYIEQMLAGLGKGDFFKLSSWFAYAPVESFLAYWDTSQLQSQHYRVAPGQSIVPVQTTHLSAAARAEWIHATLWGYGFSYIYRKAIWEAVRLRPTIVGWNDYCFARDVLQQGFETLCMPDVAGIVLHVIHTSNVSMAVPQYQLPISMLADCFGPAGLAYLQQCQHDVRGDESVMTAPRSTPLQRQKDKTLPSE